MVADNKLKMVADSKLKMVADSKLKSLYANSNCYFGIFNEEFLNYDE